MLSEFKQNSPVQQLETADAPVLRKQLWFSASGMGLVLFGITLTSFLLSQLLIWVGSCLNLFTQVDGALKFAGSDAAWQVINILIYIPMMLLPALFYALFSKTRISEAVCLKRPRKRTAFPAFFMGLGACIVMQVIVSLLVFATRLAGIELISPEIQTPHSLEGQMFYVLYLSILPAFLEEIVFRGILLHSLRRFGDGFAIVVSAVLFGLIHGNPIQMIFATVIGLVLAFVRLQTGSLWVSIAIHLMNNLLSCVLSLGSLYLSDERLSFLMLGCYALFMLAGMIALLITVSRNRDLLRPVGWSGCAVSAGGRVVRFFLSPGMVLAAAWLLWTAAGYVRVIR